MSINPDYGYKFIDPKYLFKGVIKSGIGYTPSLSSKIERFWWTVETWI